MGEYRIKRLGTGYLVINEKLKDAVFCKGKLAAEAKKAELENATKGVTK